MRTLPRFETKRTTELERAWRGKHDERARRRLQVLRLVAQHRLTAGELAEAAGGRPTMFNHVRAFQEGGTAALLATVDKDICATFLRQINELDPRALHLVLWNHAGFHPRDSEASVSANVRLPGLPPYPPRTQSGRGPRRPHQASGLCALRVSVVKSLLGLRFLAFQPIRRRD